MTTAIGAWRVTLGHEIPVAFELQSKILGDACVKDGDPDRW